MKHSKNPSFFFSSIFVFLASISSQAGPTFFLDLFSKHSIESKLRQLDKDLTSIKDLKGKLSLAPPDIQELGGLGMYQEPSNSPDEDREFDGLLAGLGGTSRTVSPHPAILSYLDYKIAQDTLQANSRIKRLFRWGDKVKQDTEKLKIAKDRLLTDATFIEKTHTRAQKELLFLKTLHSSIPATLDVIALVKKTTPEIVKELPKLDSPCDPVKRSFFARFLMKAKPKPSVNHLMAAAALRKEWDDALDRFSTLYPLNEKNLEGLTALSFAIRKKNFGIANKLLDNNGILLYSYELKWLDELARKDTISDEERLLAERLESNLELNLPKHVFKERKENRILRLFKKSTEAESAFADSDFLLVDLDEALGQAVQKRNLELVHTLLKRGAKPGELGKHLLRSLEQETEVDSRGYLIVGALEAQLQLQSQLRRPNTSVKPKADQHLFPVEAIVPPSLSPREERTLVLEKISNGTVSEQELIQFGTFACLIKPWEEPFLKAIEKGNYDLVRRILHHSRLGQGRLSQVLERIYEKLDFPTLNDFLRNTSYMGPNPKHFSEVLKSKSPEPLSDTFLKKYIQLPHAIFINSIDSQDSEKLKELLDYGSPFPSLRELLTKEENPLTTAARLQSLPVVKLLLQSLETKPNKKKFLLSDTLTKVYTEATPEVLELLLKQGAHYLGPDPETYLKTLSLKLKSSPSLSKEDLQASVPPLFDQKEAQEAVANRSFYLSPVDYALFQPKLDLKPLLERLKNQGKLNLLSVILSEGYDIAPSLRILEFLQAGAKYTGNHPELFYRDISTRRQSLSPEQQSELRSLLSKAISKAERPPIQPPEEAPKVNSETQTQMADQ